jgi:outer membrane lipoprotein-sorting protein
LNKFISTLFFVFFLASVSLASTSEVTPQDLIARLKAAQAQIADMQADTTTTVTSNIQIPGQTSKGPQTMVQTGHIWQKGTDKSKTEIDSPTKQITITNGTQMTIISPDTGQKVTQDMSKGLGAGAKGLDQTKALDYFNLTVTQSGTDEYVLSGSPKTANQFLGRMDFFIDGTRNVPVRIAMYTPQGSLMSLSEMEYTQVEVYSAQGGGVSSGESVWVPSKIKSVVTMSMGSINSDMDYSNVKVNEGIQDSVFEE